MKEREKKGFFHGSMLVSSLAAYDWFYGNVDVKVRWEYEWVLLGLWWRMEEGEREGEHHFTNAI